MREYIIMKNKINILLIVLLVLIHGISFASNDSLQGIIQQLPDKTSQNAIKTDNFEQFLSLRPLPEYSAIDEELVSKRLDEYITHELLYQEALRQELDKDPQIHYRIQQILVQALIEKQVNQPVHEMEVTEKQLHKYYQDHIDEYVHPEQRRIALIHFPVETSMSPDDKEVLKEKVQKIIIDIHAAKASTQLFKQVFENNEANSKVTDFFAKTDTDLAPEVMDSAFALRASGSVCETSVCAQDGYYIIMLVSKKSPIETEYEKQKEIIRQLIIRERIEQAEAKLIDRLKKQSKIQIAPEMVKEITIELNKKYKNNSNSVLTPDFRGNKKESKNEN